VPEHEEVMPREDDRAPRSRAELRRERLAAELRANLKKRKAQARNRAAAGRKTGEKSGDGDHREE
jgi:hypothetical protein